MVDVLLDNLSVGYYYRHIADDGTRTYMYFNKIIQDFFGCRYAPSSQYWLQKEDDYDDDIVMHTCEPFRIERQIKDETHGKNIWLVFIKRKEKAPEDKGGYYIFTTAINVSDRKADEILLDKSRKSLQMATEAGKISTWELDTATKELTITNGLDVSGNTISLEDHILLRHYEKDSPSYSDLLDVMSGKMDAGQGLYMVKDRATGDLLYRKSYFKGVKENGRVTHIYGITQDVTETFRNKELLNNNRDELNLALDAGSISAWTYDPKEKMFRTLYGQAIAKEGTSLEDLLKILHPDDREKLVFILDSIVSRQAIDSDYYFRFQDADNPGSYRCYDSKMKGRVKNGKVMQIIGTQRDVTAEHLYQEQLEEFSLKTNLINEATNSVFWDYDIEKRVLLTNSDKALLPHEPIPLEKYLMFVRPEEREYVSNFFIKADNRTLEDFSFEIDLMLPGYDTYRRIIANGVPVRDEKGNIIKYTGVRKDISDITRLNHELQEQNILKNVVVNNVFVGLILFSSDYKVIWSNDYATSAFSALLHSDRCTEGTPCELLVKHKCTRDQGKCLLRKAIETGIIQKGERVFGHNEYLEISAIPIFDENKKVTRVMLKIRDTTQQKQMIEELKVSREKAIEASDFVNTLMDKMPASIFIEDPDDNFRIIKVNDAFAATIHLPKREIEGKTISELLGKEVGKKYEPYDLMLVNGSSDGTINYEGDLIIDNQKIHSLIHKSIISMRGHRFILAISSDITQMKKINDELAIANEKALTADKLKSAFLANMSHEIRTPLNSIIGFSELLCESDNPEEKAEYSQIIKNNNQMLLRLISDILDLSKIESGNTEFKRDLVEVSSYFNELTASLAIRCTNQDVKFIVENPYKTCYINMDRLRFGQVVTNFVTNAIKYTTKGYIKVGYYIERHGVTIRVEDTGIGIPANKRDRVFTRFDKLDSMAQGTGLGLSIAKVLTETGGGKIWFESEEDKGTTFYSWKPFSDIRVLKAEGCNNFSKTSSAEPIKEKIITTSSDSRHIIRKILVAEDNSSNFILLQKILSGYEIEWAKDGVEAVEKVAKSRFDLILMDIKMPIMDGLDATRQIRKFNSSIPIVAVSANAYAVDKDEALIAGCNDFLAKPILKDDVLSILAKI